MGLTKNSTTQPTTATTATPKPIARKQLNELQTELLQILYKFRFGNASLISRYQGQSVRNINVRLKNLSEQEYIDRFYSNNDRINRRQATYFLLPNAVRLLQKDPELDFKGLHLNYSSRTASPTFVSHWLRMFRIYLKFDELYGSKNLDFYTNSELAEETKFPKVRPDAFLSFDGKHSDIPDSMFDLLESNKAADYNRQKTLRYIYHYETTSDWGSDYPRILLVCDNAGLERDIQQTIARTMNFRGNTKPQYYTTTLKALYGARNTKDPIWSNVLEPEMLLSL